MSLNYDYISEIIRVIDEDRKLKVSDHIMRNDIEKILNDVKQFHEETILENLEDDCPLIYNCPHFHEDEYNY